MNTYETTAKVEDQGQVRLAGVPFAPGTEVEVSIRAKERPEAGLSWAGNVLVHQGVGAGPSVTDLRHEHLNRFGMT